MKYSFAKYQDSRKIKVAGNVSWKYQKCSQYISQEGPEFDQTNVSMHILTNAIGDACKQNKGQKVNQSTSRKTLKE